MSVILKTGVLRKLEIFFFITWTSWNHILLNMLSFPNISNEIMLLVASLVSTLYNAILRIARNFLETRENIKISTHPFYHINLDWFSWKWSKKKFEMTDSKKLRFSSPPILNNFSWRFHELVLRLIGLIDAKDIDVAQL